MTKFPARLLRIAIIPGALLLSQIAPQSPASLVSPVQAGVRVSIGFDTFYDRLGDYGDWVWLRGRYVWVPADVSDNWRPYVLGHWVWTHEYGWLWVSDEPFGWATYHYGRWGFSREIGWYWVPGTRWAPAWVSWQYSDEDIVWAPLPPGDSEFDVEIGVNEIPDYYWNCVPADRFLDHDLYASVVFDIGRRHRILESVEPAGNVTIQNNVIINNAINVNIIERSTGAPVRPVRVVSASQPGTAHVSDGTVTVFRGKVEPRGNPPPEHVVDQARVHESYARRKDKIAESSGQPDVLAPLPGHHGKGGETLQKQEPGRGPKSLRNEATPGVTEPPPGRHRAHGKLPEAGQDSAFGPGQGEQPPAHGRKKQPRRDQGDYMVNPEYDPQQPAGRRHRLPPPPEDGGQTFEQPNFEGQAPSRHGHRQQQLEQQGGQGFEQPNYEGQAPSRHRNRQQQIEQQGGQSFEQPNYEGQAPSRHGHRQQQIEQQVPEPPPQMQEQGQGDNPGKHRGRGKQLQCDPGTDPNCASGQ